MNDEVAYLIDNLPELPTIFAMQMTKAQILLLTTIPVRGRLMIIEAVLMATSVTIPEGTQTRCLSGGDLNDRSTTIEAMRLETGAAPLEEAVDILMVGAAVDALNNRFMTIKAI